MRDPFAVLDWLVSRHVHACLDTAGRPVGEGRSTVIQDVETEMRTCPYQGSRHRHEKPMNASAIQCMPAWPQLLGVIRWLSHRHRLRYGGDVTTSNDLARITSAGIMLVDYLALRREQPVGSTEVPLLVSGVYKICLGYQLAYLPERFSENDEPTILPDATGFLEYLEADGLLIGEAEVCSCPPELILQSYEAMTQATENVVAPHFPVEIDWDRFDDFAEAAADIWREIVMFAIRMPELMPKLNGAELPDDVRERLNGLLSERATHLLEKRDGLVVGVAESVRGILGSPITPPPERTSAPSVILPDTLASTVLEWLRRNAPEDIASYGSAVGAELGSQLGPYDDYEAGVLRRINVGLDRVMKALHLESGSALTERALSRLCGRSMRDWDAD